MQAPHRGHSKSCLIEREVLLLTVCCRLLPPAVIMPASALRRLTLFTVTYPMMFKVRASPLDRYFIVTATSETANQCNAEALPRGVSDN